MGAGHLIFQGVCLCVTIRRSEMGGGFILRDRNLFVALRRGFGRFVAFQPTTMSYTVTSSRSIPASETHTSLILKKTVTTELVHGGKSAVCVKLQDGRMAWGFGINDSEAESAAVVAAMSI